MKIAIIQFPGSNCERETILAVKRAEMEAVEFLWNESSEKLSAMDGFIIVGGFAYEDRSRAGVIAALDPVMKAIKEQAALGKPVLGICNGAQILVEAGMVPGVENDKVVMALTENKRVANNKILGTGYYNAWVHLKLAKNYQRNAFTLAMRENDILFVPLAHGEGRFVMSNALLNEITEHGLGVFQYCNNEGGIDSNFPVNPNASLNNLAAVSNKMGNVMAIMPHPERCEDGDIIFESMRLYIEEQLKTGWQQKEITPLYYYPRQFKLENYQLNSEIHQYLTELMITDNQALTVEQTLKQHGLDVKVKRYQHWEIEAQDKSTFEEIKKSEVLYNPRKEREIDPRALKNTKPANSHYCLLVKSKENILGTDKKQLLQDHYKINNIHAISHGIVWEFSSDNLTEEELLQSINNSHIVYNASAHDCYQYHYSKEEYYSAVAG